MDSLGEHYLRVAVETISIMMAQNRALSETYLFKPLMKPLAYLTRGIGNTCMYIFNIT